MSIKVSILIPMWNQEELIVKCLDSIPRRDDLEVIVCDDASTDGSLRVAREYANNHPELRLTVMSNTKNAGAAACENRMLKQCAGEYFHILDSDDYLITEEYDRVIDEIDGSDIIGFALEINDGSTMVLTDENKVGLCGQTIRFVRRAAADGLEFPEHMKSAYDYAFNKLLLSRNISAKYTGIVAYHYNFPREGSLYDLMIKGKL